MSVASAELSGVSFVVPVGGPSVRLAEVLKAILAEDPGDRPFEVLVVDDRGVSTPPLALGEADLSKVRVLTGPARGPAAALNLAMAEARHPVLAQVAEDMVIEAGWLEHLMSALASEPTLAAVQAYPRPQGEGSLWARVRGLDLEDRYSNLPPWWVDHVTAGNAVFRTEALRRIGGYDETLAHGYDHDVSYRLADAGYRMAFCRDARSRPHWRDRGLDYLRHQLGAGYARLELISRHWRRLGGDQLSGPAMMAHAGVMAAAVLSLFVALGFALARRPWEPAALVALGLCVGLSAERLWRGARLSRRLGDSAALLFPVVHFVRDLAWVGAIGAWAVSRLKPSNEKPPT